MPEAFVLPERVHPKGVDGDEEDAEPALAPGPRAAPQPEGANGQPQ